jgi:hypothetical protein
MIDEETFWYILQNGKFPPYETIMNKKKKEMMATAQHQQEIAMMQQQQPEQPPQEGMPPQGGEPPPDQGMDGSMVEEVLRNNPDMLAKFNSLSPEMQQQVMQQIQSGDMYF